MPDLLFQPPALLLLTLITVLLVSMGYLLSVRDKSPATWWLVAAFAGFLLSFLTALVSSLLVYTPPSLNKFVDLIVIFSGPTLGLWSLLHFAYRFLENPFAREARIVLWVTGLLLAVDLGLEVCERIFGLIRVDDGISVLLLLGYISWSTVVLLRKRRRALHKADADTPLRAASAYRAYALLNGLFIVILASLALGTFGVLPGETGGWFSSVLLLLLFGFLFGLVVVYLNHAPEPTTLQAKLAGLTLVTAMALLAMVIPIAYPQYEVAAAYPTPPRDEALRFVPDEAGGYQVTTLPAALDTALGERLALTNGADTTVALGFDFPFYGRRHAEVIIHDDPTAAFGPFANLRTSEVPLILPLTVGLDPGRGGGVYLNRAARHVTITWHEMIVAFSTDTVTVQLRLHAAGAIDFLYGDIDASRVIRGVRGLLPGGTPPRLEAMSNAASLAERQGVEPGEAVLENYRLAYRLRAHEEVKAFVWLTLGAVFFILVVFPFFFRSSLLRPLMRLRQGMQRVDAGELDAEVPVMVRDEIGHLTHHFNGMTASLRRYSRQMETLVEERTAALKQSLQDLKTTQAQLVQQEKMASLGQLTAGIAHEIKNPLNFINNFAEVNEELAQELREAVARGEDLTAIIDDLEQNARVINQHGRRADSIVRAMMQHASGGTGQREATDVNALVSEHLDLAYHGKRAQQTGFTCTIERDLGEDVGTVEVVPQEVGRVLLNLLGNAFDAVQGLPDPKVTVSTRQADGRVEIRVIDNGPGIPDEIREKIFEPFFTTKPTGSGTGLGLSLSYDIVTQGHGGTLKVESENGRGTTFTVTLPADPPT